MNKKELYSSELEKEDLVILKYICQRKILIEEQKEILKTQSINDNNSYMSLSNYNKFSNKRNEVYKAIDDEIHALEDKIKEYSRKISSLEVKLGKKKSKETKKEYQTLCDRINCEGQIRKSWLLETSLNDYKYLKKNRMMLISRLEQDPNRNEKLLSDLKEESNNITDQIEVIESSRHNTLTTLDILSVDRNGLLDRGKQLIKK